MDQVPENAVVREKDSLVGDIGKVGMSGSLWCIDECARRISGKVRGEQIT